MNATAFAVCLHTASSVCHDQRVPSLARVIIAGQPCAGIGLPLARLLLLRYDHLAAVR